MQGDIKTYKESQGNIILFEEIQSDLQKKFLQNPNLSVEYCRQALTQEDFLDIRFSKLTKFVYEKDIKISYKLRSVFSAIHSSGATFITKIVSDGKTCDIYFGVKSTDAVKNSNILQGALTGNFPGTSFEKNKEVGNLFLSNDEVKKLNGKIFSNNNEITAVVGIPSLKDKEEEQFIQGIENLILGMNGKAFSAIFIAEPVSPIIVENTIDVYEQIYSVFSPQKEFSVTDGTNESTSISDGLTTTIGVTTTKGSTKGVSNSKGKSETEGTNDTENLNKSPWFGKKIATAIFGGKMSGSSSGKNQSHTDSETVSTSNSDSNSDSNSKSESKSESSSNTQGTSTSKQLTYNNKKVSNFLDRLDKQIERLEQGKGTGFWNVGAYFVSDDVKNSIIAANIYNGVIKGAESCFETSVIKTFSKQNEKEKVNVENFLKCYQIPRLENGHFLAQAVTTDELTVQINLPHKSVVGLDVVEITPFGNNPKKVDKAFINIGKLYNYEKEFDNEIHLNYNDFTGHIFVTGSTGSGKSNVTYNLINKLSKKNINFLVIEPAKGEYKDEFGGRSDVSVYGTNPNFTEVLKINPFSFPKGIHIYEHIDRFIEILNACWPMEASMPNLLKKAVEYAYEAKGWLLDESRCIDDEEVFPTFLDLLDSLKKVIEESGYSAEIKSNYEGALLTRVESLTNGLNKLIFVEKGIDDKKLFDENVIADLSKVPSTEGKALLMGILFMKLSEYRIANKTVNNSRLKHITILEEAHNLLKRTSHEQSQGSANLAGKSVEMISNAIAEMRTYGEGFIIADQAPGLLDMSAIRNTNTKICLRLPDMEDRKLVGNAMNLSDEQIKELANLDTGVAAIYQNNWQEAILCKFDKYNSDNEEFRFVNKNNSKANLNKILRYLKSSEISEENIRFIDKVLNTDFIHKQIKLKDESARLTLIKLPKSISKILNIKLDEESLKLLTKYVVEHKEFPLKDKMNIINNKLN